MSFLTILTMVSITVPGIAKYLQAALLNFIYMDLLKTDLWLIPLIFPNDSNSEKKNDEPQYTEDGTLVQKEVTDDDNTPLNDYFDNNGFSTKIALKNLGSTTIYLGIILYSLLLIPILNYFKGSS